MEVKASLPRRGMMEQAPVHRHARCARHGRPARELLPHEGIGTGGVHPDRLAGAIRQPRLDGRLFEDAGFSGMRCASFIACRLRSPRDAGFRFRGDPAANHPALAPDAVGGRGDHQRMAIRPRAYHLAHADRAAAGTAASASRAAARAWPALPAGDDGVWGFRLRGRRIRLCATSTSPYPVGVCHIQRARLGCPQSQHAEPP